MGYNEKQDKESKRDDHMIKDLTIAMPTIFNKIGNIFSSSEYKSNLEKINLTNTIKSKLIFLKIFFLHTSQSDNISASKDYLGITALEKDSNQINLSKIHFDE